MMKFLIGKHNFCDELKMLPLLRIQAQRCTAVATADALAINHLSLSVCVM
jgi:hypothetical protein